MSPKRLVDRRKRQPKSTPDTSQQQIYRDRRAASSQPATPPQLYDEKLNRQRGKLSSARPRRPKAVSYVLLRLGRPKQDIDVRDGRDWNDSGKWREPQHKPNVKIEDTKSTHSGGFVHVDDRHFVMERCKGVDQNIEQLLQTSQDAAWGKTITLPQRLVNEAKPSEPAADGELWRTPKGHNGPGTKRARDSRPLKPAKSRRRYAHHPSSLVGANDDDSENSSSDSQRDYASTSSSSDFGDDTDSEFEEDSDTEDYLLDDNHVFQETRTDLVQVLYDKFQSWMASRLYVQPPDDRLPIRKDCIAANGQLWSTYVEEFDEADEQLVVISRVDGYFHLACPIYVSDPERHRRCLLEHDLLTMEDVIRHIRHHHMEPPYCPVCRRSFDDTQTRDQHLLERTCKVGPAQSIDGISVYQKNKMLKRDRLYLGELRRWRRIWKTIFPDTRLNRSPYLKEGIERAVSMFHDYWRLHGESDVQSYLEEHGLLLWTRPDEEKALAALNTFTMEDLLDRLLHEHGLAFDRSRGGKA